MKLFIDKEVFVMIHSIRGQQYLSSQFTYIFLSTKFRRDFNEKY
jgi:hypothetical protein